MDAVSVAEFTVVVSLFYGVDFGHVVFMGVKLTIERICLS